MPMPIIPPLHIRHLLSGNADKSSKTPVTAPLGVAKCLKTSNTDVFGKNFSAGGAKGNYSNPNDLLISDKMPEKLGSIHSKLFAEAEKIQKWKTSVEIEQQQREKKLQDTYRIVDSLRKEILDLQLQNESLSMQLTDEVQNRNDVLQKHQSTRELCVALKKHFDGLEEKIKYAQEIKESFEVMENQRLNAFEDLAEKFDALNLTHMEQVRTFNNIITSKEREMNALRDACNNQIFEANKQLEYLTEVRETKEHDVMRLSSELKEKEMFCDNIALEKKQLLLEVSSLKENNSTLAFQLQETNEHMYKIKAEKSELETQHALSENRLSEQQHIIAELKDQFLNYQKESEAKISSLEIILKDSNRKLSDEKQNVAKQQAVVEDRENLIKSLCDSKELLEQQIAQLKKDVQTGLQLQEKINDLEEEIKSVCKERDEFCSNFEHTKICLSEKESVCTSLHTEIKAKEDFIASLRVQNDELQLQVKDISSREKVKVQELEQLKHICDEKDHLRRDFEKSEFMLSVKESLCDTLGQEVDNKQKEISDLVAQNKKLQMQIQNLFADKDASRNQEESLKEELGIAENRYLELSSMKDELEKILTDKQKELEDAAVENETKVKVLEASLKEKEREVNELETELSKLDYDLSKEQIKNQSFLSALEAGELEVKKLDTSLKAKEKELTELEASLKAKEKELTELEASFKAKEKELTELEASFKAKEKDVYELEDQISKLNSDLSEKQIQKQSFLSALEEGKLENEEMRMKLESLLRTQEELREENSKLKDSFCEAEAERKAVSVALEEEKEKLKALEQEMTSKDSTVVLLESKITSLESKINDLIEEKSNLKEAHALQIRDMLLQNERSHELLALHEKSQNDYRKDSIERERKIQSLQSKIQKLENHIRFGSNRGETENLKAENSRLKELVEKLKAESEKKGEIENLKAENSRLKELVEKLKAESEKKGEIGNLKAENSRLKELVGKLKADSETTKKTEVPKASARYFISKTGHRFKVVDDKDSSASETLELELQKTDEPVTFNKVNLPQKRVAIGKPMKAACHQAMGKSNTFGNQDGNKKLKLGGGNDQDVLGNKYIEEKKKTISTRKFFKSQRSSASPKEPNLAWFDLDPTYGFFE